MIDTHCHLYLDQFKEDIQEVLERAAEADLSHIFMPAITFDSLPKMDKLNHPEIAFHKMAGIHPTSINEGEKTTEEELYDYCNGADILGVGETGLDYYWSDEYKSAQKKNLNIHCEVAKEIEKPIILHNRESTSDLLDVIEQQQNGSLKGIWHSFTGSVEEGQRAIDLGLHLGIGGIFTFKNARVDDAVAQLPLDKMMLETDAPYLAPTPKRGKRNEPAFVRFTARRLAEVKGLPVDEVTKQTSRTALELFGLIR